MARATNTSKVVHQTRRQKLVQLTLTEGEADFLLAVLARVGGHKTNSPRKYQVRIKDALQRATGITYKETDANQLAYGVGMGFRDYDDPKGGSAQRRKPAAPPPYRPNRELIGYMEKGQHEPDAIKIDGPIDPLDVGRWISEYIKRRYGNQSPRRRLT